MKLGLGMAAMAVVLVLAATAPALAEVKTLELAQESYTEDEKIVFEGTARPGDDMFAIEITKESSKKSFRGKDSRAFASVYSNGEFTAPMINTVDDIFRNRDGIYNVTVTAGGGSNMQNGVTLLQIQYSGGEVTKYVPPVPKIILQLEDKLVRAGDPGIVTIKLGEGSIRGATYSITDRPSGTDGARIIHDKLIWTPTMSHASYLDNPYEFTIQAKKGSVIATETVTITVRKAFDAPPAAPSPKPAPKITQTGFVVDKEPQSYVDRYDKEPDYKAWFDRNYPQYTSIYDAVGLEAPKQLAPFVKEGVDPQTYVDRYDKEPAYKKWFDKTYPQYTSIYEAVGLEEPKPLASFVDPAKNPQTYVDRYENEPKYKSWFDKTFPQYVSIYEAVGIKQVSAEPEKKHLGTCGAGTVLDGDTCVIPEDEQIGFCGEMTTHVDGVCVITSTIQEKPWWQFW